MRTLSESDIATRAPINVRSDLFPVIAMRKAPVVPRHARSALLLACLLPIVTSCAQRETPVQIGDREQILHLGNGSEPSDLDPHRVTGVTEHNIISALLEGLVSEDPHDLSPRPGVAERWTVSADGRVYTFRLRPDARWSNGDPVRATDFAYAFKRMLSPRRGAPYAYMLFCLDKAEAYNKEEITNFADVGVHVQDDHTLILTLTTPVAYFLSLLNHYSWFPVHPPTIDAFGGIDAIGSHWTHAGNFVGNGAFTLEHWKPNDVIAVRKSATYWDHEIVTLNEIHFHPIGDPNIEERSFRVGQLHVTGTIPMDRIQHYRDKAPELLRLDSYLGCYYYHFNVTRSPLDNVTLRRALAMAVDRESIVKYVTKAGEEPAYHFTPPETAGYSATARLPFNLARARELLAEAGYPEGRGLRKIQLLFNTSDAHARIAQVIQQMWEKGLGVEIELVNMEWKVYLDHTQEKKYDIARAGWISDYEDPNSFLDMWVTDGGNNRSGWSNAEYDALIAKARGVLDTAARYNIFQKAEEILLREAPILPIYFYKSKSLIQPSVQGWHPTILDHHPYKYIRLQAQP